MSLFGISFLTIALTAVIAIILAIYTTFLVNLKPSKDSKPATNRKSKRKGKTSAKLKGVKKLKRSAEAVKTLKEKLVSATKVQGIQEEPSELDQPLSQTSKQEDEKKKIVKEKKKSFFLFGKTSFERCPHEFGHLKNLPRNAPIPDECFGCPQILECLKA